MVLPNLFEMHLFGVCDEETYDKNLKVKFVTYSFNIKLSKKHTTSNLSFGLMYTGLK